MRKVISKSSSQRDKGSSFEGYKSVFVVRMIIVQDELSGTPLNSLKSLNILK